MFEQYSDLLTLQEVSEILRISLAETQELIQSGSIMSIRIKQTILVPKPFLLTFIENHRSSCYTEKTEQNFMHLDNSIAQKNLLSISEGVPEMAKKINQSVMINGKKVWIRANSMQEFTDKILSHVDVPQDSGKHLFSEYAWSWYNIYAEPNIESATAVTYKRQLTLHLIPAFDEQALEDITTDDVQRLFNGMNGSKATKNKARVVLNQILDAAVEDRIIPQNPAKSRRVKITGKASKAIVPYSVEQMRYLVQHLGDIQNPFDRAYLALQALHPLRLEEVLGLEPSDIDTRSMRIHIRRAVTHPTRNQPEIKDTKTDSSYRTIGLSALALPFLQVAASGRFLLGGDQPLSYTQVRRMCQRIEKDIGFPEKITPIRFRTTVLTDLYDQTKDIKLAQAAAGHTTPAMTLKYYVKGREITAETTAAVDRAYGT